MLAMFSHPLSLWATSWNSIFCRACAEILSDNDIENNRDGDSQNINLHYRASEPNIINVDSHGTRTYSTRSSSKHLDVEELEMLLEAYFIQIDSTLNKLSTVSAQVTWWNHYEVYHKYEESSGMCYKFVLWWPCQNTVQINLAGQSSSVPYWAGYGI